jgi:agmatinase
VSVSIDIDALDVPLVPGCASPEPGGFEYHEPVDMVAYIAEHHEVVGFDVVEVNPMLDTPAKITALLAAQLMLEFLGPITSQPRWKARHPVAALTSLGQPAVALAGWRRSPGQA